MSEQSRPRERSDFEKAIQQYIEAVDAADERLEQVYKKANEMYEAGKLSEAYHHLLVYFMLDQEAHLRNTQMRTILYQSYGRALDYCGILTPHEALQKASPLSRELQAGYIDVTNRVERASNSLAYSLLNRINDDLRDIEAQNPTLAQRRAEGIKDREELVGAINELAKAGRVNLDNEYVQALMDKTDDLLEDAHATITTMQSIISDLKNTQKLITLSELDVLSMMHQLTDAYNTTLIAQHILMPAVKANVLTLMAIENDPKHDEYAQKLNELREKLDSVVRLTEKGMYVQIDSQETDKPIELYLRFGKKNDEHSLQGLEELMQGTQQIKLDHNSAGMRGRLKIGRKYGITAETTFKGRTETRMFDTKSGIITRQASAKGVQSLLTLEAGPMLISVKGGALDREAMQKILAYNGQVVDSKGKMKQDEDRKEAIKEAGHKAYEKGLEEGEKFLKGEELSKFVPADIVGNLIGVQGTIAYTSRAREKQMPVIDLKLKLSDLWSESPTAWLKPIPENVGHIVDLFKKDEINPVARIAQSVVNLEHANLSDLTKTIQSELDKLGHIDPCVIFEEVMHIVERDEMAQYQLRGHHLLPEHLHEGWNKFVTDAYNAKAAIAQAMQADPENTVLTQQNYDMAALINNIGTAIDMVEETWGRDAQEVLGYLYGGWGSDGIDIAPILEVARDNLHSEVLGEVLEKLEQFRDRVDDPFAYPNQEEIKALFEEGQGQGQGQDLDDQTVVQGIA
ncbi:MAG: hypothetical protein IJ419_11290 [Agathobacter sp.]|nr:hypothetical protein [Agathobacter sp.]